MATLVDFVDEAVKRLESLHLTLNFLPELVTIFKKYAGTQPNVDLKTFTDALVEFGVYKNVVGSYFRAADGARAGTTVDYREFILGVLCIDPSLLSVGAFDVKHTDFLTSLYTTGTECKVMDLIDLILHLNFRIPDAHELDCRAKAASQIEELGVQISSVDAILPAATFASVLSKLVVSKNTKTVNFSHAVELHFASCPHMEVNGRAIYSKYLADSESFVFVVPQSVGTVSAMTLTVGELLRNLLQDHGDMPLDVDIRVARANPQRQTLSSVHFYQLSWALNPPFVLSHGDMEFTISGFNHFKAGRPCPHGNDPTDGSTLPNPDTVSWQLAGHAVKISREDGSVIAKDELQSLTLERATSNYSGAVMKQRGTLNSLANTSNPTIDEILASLQGFADLGFKGNCLSGYANKLVALANSVHAIVKGEPRLIRIKSPAYVFGDFHGNFEDLKMFEKAFWKQGVAFCPAHLLFLGDYVDRREYGLEVVTYLFANKLLSPSKMTMLRGNHEAADMNARDGFKVECMRKLGEIDGNKVWRAFNDAFNCLPLCAVVGETVFCVHGGIPGPDYKGDNFFNDIENVPNPLIDPEADNILARDLLWSDPMEVDAADGSLFVHNDDRQISHKYSTNALIDFLKKNKFQMIIRAHQYKVHLGFQIQKHAKLITVFSSSGYGGIRNESSCVFVADGKIRAMRLDGIATAM